MDMELLNSESGPSSLSSDQGSLCVIPDPDESSEEDGFIYLDRNSLPSSLNPQNLDRTVIVFHSVDEEYFDDQDVVCQYIRPSGWKEAFKDEVALFKVGWVSTGECVAKAQVTVSDNDTNPIGCATFSAGQLPKGTSDLYQFCYMQDMTLLGASTPFQLKSSVSENDCGSKSEEGDDSDIVILKTLEEQLAGELHRRDAELGRLQEEFTKLSCSNEELSRVHASTLEGVQLQLQHQTESVSQLVVDKITLEKEKAELATRVERLEAMVEKMNSASRSIDAPQPKSLKVVPSAQNLGNDTKQTAVGINFNAEELQKQLTVLNEQLRAVIQEKGLFQDQLADAAVSLKERVTQLKTVEAQCSTFHEQMMEHMVIHNMILSQNAALREELNKSQNELTKKGQGGEHKAEEHCTMCEEYKKKSEELEFSLTGSNLVRDMVQLELEEELKLGEDRDRRLAQLEQTMLENLRAVSTRTRVNFFGTGAIMELEENTRTVLDALECSLKELDTVRERKAALSRANRALCLQLGQEQEKWKSDKEAKDATIAELKANLQNHQSQVISLKNRIAELEHAAHDQAVPATDQNTLIPQDALEALRREMSGGCCDPKLQVEKQHDSKDLVFKESSTMNGSDEKCTCGVGAKLAEAREVYCNLYMEKESLQKKLERLQNKIRSKLNAKCPKLASPGKQDSSSIATHSRTAWTAIVDELM